MTYLALPLIAAGLLGASAGEMGVLSAAGTAPALLIGLFAGVWVDRFRRRSLMIATDVGRALLLATIPLAVALDVLTFWQLAAVAFAIGTLGVVRDISARSILPDLVTRQQLAGANGKLELSGSATAVVGPGLAGVVIEALGAPVAILLDCGSYLFSALCASRIGLREARPVTDRAPMLSQVREGIALVLKSPYLRALVGCEAVSNLASNAFFALYVLYGTRVLGMDAARLGFVYGLGATGAVLAALVGPRIGRRVGDGRAILLGAITGSLEVLPAALATPDTALPMLVLSSFLGNFGWVLYNVHAVSLRQTVTPAPMLGRVTATYSTVVVGMLPLGALLGGALGDLLGLRSTIVLAALASAGAWLWVFHSPVRAVRRIGDLAPSIEGGS